MNLMAFCRHNWSSIGPNSDHQLQVRLFVDNWPCTGVKQNELCFVQKDTQKGHSHPSQICPGGQIIPNPTQNRCGWCLFAYGEYKLYYTRLFNSKSNNFRGKHIHRKFKWIWNCSNRRDWPCNLKFLRHFTRLTRIICLDKHHTTAAYTDWIARKRNALVLCG